MLSELHAVGLVAIVYGLLVCYAMVIITKQAVKIMKLEQREGLLHVSIKSLHEECNKGMERVKKLEQSNVSLIQQLIGLGVNPFTEDIINERESSDLVH
jgi:hypothetical protein